MIQARTRVNLLLSCLLCLYMSFPRYSNPLSLIYSFFVGSGPSNPISGINLDVNTMADIYKKFALEPGTQDFIGHSLALHIDDTYIQKPARDSYDRIHLYVG